jgi:hypothetical protein
MLRFRVFILFVLSLQALGAVEEVSMGCCCWGRSAKVAPAPLPRLRDAVVGTGSSVVTPAEPRGRKNTVTTDSVPVMGGSPVVSSDDWGGVTKNLYVGPYAQFIYSLLSNGVIVEEESILSWVNAHVGAISWISEEDHKASLVAAVIKRLERCRGANAGTESITAEATTSLARQILPYAPVIEGQDTRPYYEPFIRLICSLSKHSQRVIPDRALVSFIRDQVNAMPWGLSETGKPQFVDEVIAGLSRRDTSSPSSPSVPKAFTSDGAPLSRGDSEQSLTDVALSYTSAGAGVLV